MCHINKYNNLQGLNFFNTDPSKATQTNMVHMKCKLWGRLCWSTFVVFHMDIRHHDVRLFIPSDIFLANCWIFVEPSTKILPLEATPRFHLLFLGIRNMTTMRTCLVGVTLAPINAKYCTYSGPSRVVGIVTGYVLEGPGIKSRWQASFPHLSRQPLGPTQSPV